MQMFNIIFFGTLIFSVIIFIIVLLIFISPKFRAKMMSRQLRSQEYFIEKEKENLTNMVRETADISKEGVEIVAHAVKEGFINGETEKGIQCENCGTWNDFYSKFCKNCGKKLK